MRVTGQLYASFVLHKIAEQRHKDAQNVRRVKVEADAENHDRQHCTEATREVNQNETVRVKTEGIEQTEQLDQGNREAHFEEDLERPPPLEHFEDWTEQSE